MDTDFNQEEKITMLYALDTYLRHIKILLDVGGSMLI